ncbi:MAG: glutamate racemase [Clostridia bacterium]|nr:glutamate racemase [Clostridia bacterium]
MQIPHGGIAFFDSGIGGLTVLSACEKYFDDGVFYYYGDNKHAPYGNLSPKKIRRYVFRAFKTFQRLRVRAAVLACNTATAVCVEELRKKYDFPIIGAEPAVCTAASKGGKILVLATRATCESERFQTLCKRAQKLFPEADICIRSCEKLAGAIERNLYKNTFDYTAYLPDEYADAVVLGCTHYIYIVEQIKAFYGCPVYHGNEGIARRLFAVTDKKTDKNHKEKPCDEKSRDGRPPKAVFRKNLGRLTTFCKRQVKRQKNVNKRLRLKGQKSLKNDKTSTLFFLGNTRENNEKVYKQMFVNNE